jgi:hypothetical protein
LIWFELGIVGVRQLTGIGERSVMWVDPRRASSVKVRCANPPDCGAMTAWKRAVILERPLMFFSRASS